MSKIQDLNKKAKYMECNKNFKSKINIDNNEKLSHDESHEISENNYSPIKISKTIKKEQIIYLTKKTNFNLEEPNKLNSENKEKNKKNNTKKAFIYFRKVLNDKKNSEINNLNS